MAVKIHIKVFQVVMLCSIAVGYLHFRGLCCLHLPSSPWKWKMEAAQSSDT